MKADDPSPSGPFHEAAVPGARRLLENPRMRCPLPGWLRDTVSYRDQDALTGAIRRGLRDAGLPDRDIGRLTIAWPQKHPHTSHPNAATNHARTLHEILRRRFPGTQIAMAHALYETRKLDRSENSSPLKTMTDEQLFSVDPALQAEPLPFLTPAGARGEAFVLTDWAVMQGTTIANLASFITHNGGHVVAVAEPYGGRALQQRGGARGDDGALGNVPRTGRIPALAAAFRNAAGDTDYSPAECVALFNRALARHGRSLSTLTDGEAETLESAFNSCGTQLASFVAQLGISPPAQRDFIDAWRRSGFSR
jgi:hypothetical protein